MSDDLRAIERQLKAAIKAKQKEVALMKARGVISTEAIPTEEERAPEDGHAARFSLAPVFKYLRALRQMIRPLLEARFQREFGEAAPERTLRSWLIEALGRKYQRALYEEAVKNEILKQVPPRVEHNDSIFELESRRMPTLPDGADDPDEPRDNLYYDAESRLVAASECPFARGRSWTAFEIVELAGEKGVGFQELVLKLSKILQYDAKKAEGKAQRMFTRWVQKGWFKLVSISRGA